MQPENVDLNLLAIICDTNRKSSSVKSYSETTPIARKQDQDPDEGIDYGLMQILGLRPPKQCPSNGQNSDSATTSRESESPVERMPKTLEEALNGHGIERPTSICNSPSTNGNPMKKRRISTQPNMGGSNVPNFPTMHLSFEEGDTKEIIALKKKALQVQIERDQAITEYYRAKTETLFLDRK
ncbi:hypothetical protein WR25_14827 [Diploscapter pachys]|uniref:Uncharacterized protein n=1 Tax=Diploscapter pachys TaxID=2018661 RepID=A0A2A2KMV9_9BILA|nr:hypothetical protein WR25_14827 [Diploscapter pachys]